MGRGAGSAGFFVLLVLLALGAPEALARRGGGGGGEFRLRISGLYGLMNFEDVSPATNARTEFEQYQPGLRLQTEAWLGPRLGVFVDTQAWYMGLFGRSVYLGAGSAGFGWRVFGDGGAMATESVVYFGPSYHYWPDVRAYAGRAFFDLVTPRVLGGLAGIRWRFGIQPKWALEVGGHYVHPLKLLGPSNAALSTSATRSIVGAVLLDTRFNEGLGGSVGLGYELNSLEYTPTGNTTPQTVTIDAISLLLSLRFWL